MDRQVRAGGPRVVIADDHPPMRLGVRRSLTDAGYDVVREAASGDAAVDAAIALHPDLCILDVRMPDGGISAAERIVVEVPETAVVMLTSSADIDTIAASLRAGAVGVLSKDADTTDLPAALQRVLDGDVALPDDLLDRMRRQPPTRRRWGRRPAAVPPDPDAARILTELHSGITIAQAADALGVTTARVRQVIAALLQISP